jgi:hypothetical protein
MNKVQNADSEIAARTAKHVSQFKVGDIIEAFVDVSEIDNQTQ